MITLDAAHEGGFQNNPNDRANWTGGQVGIGTLVGTNGGITALDMPGADIKNLTISQKVTYYLQNYWKPLYSQILSQIVANKLFDLGVLFGIGTAVNHLQMALDIPADGIFGSETLSAVNSADPDVVLARFKSAMLARANIVAQSNPNDAADLPDWIRRINS
jgi:lysozyme family protein